MLYLFNSAYRPQYIENVLNTLNLPEGAENRYQYSENSNGRCYVHDSAKDNCPKGEEALIIFIDRERKDDFRFIPLRKGIFVKVEKSAGVFYYYVRLGKICAVNNVEEFTGQLKMQMKELLFNISSSGIETGYFAFRFNEPTLDVIQNQDTAWRKTSEDLASCAHMKRVSPVFTKFSLFDSKDSEMKVTRGGRHSSKYKLRMGKPYNAKIDYFIADADLDPGVAYVELLFNNKPCKFTDELNTYRLGTRAGRLEYNFSADALTSNIALSYEVRGNTLLNKEVKVAANPVRFRICRRIASRFSLILCALGLVICNIIMALPISSILDPANAQIYRSGTSIYYNFVHTLALFLNTIDSIYLALVGFFSSVLTFFVVYLFNKKEN